MTDNRHGWLGGESVYIGELDDWVRSGTYTFTRAIVGVNCALLRINRQYYNKSRYDWTLTSVIPGESIGIHISNGSTRSVISCIRQADTALCNYDHKTEKTP